jgi:hypothetical protein
MTPAAYVISVFGGVRATGRAIGRTPECVSRWIHKMDGRVPGPSQRLVLEVARKQKLDITPNDLIYGRPVK